MSDEPKAGFSLSQIVQLVTLIVGLGVAYGALKTEVENLKRASDGIDSVQMDMLQKLTRIEQRLSDMDTREQKRHGR